MSFITQYVLPLLRDGLVDASTQIRSTLLAFFDGDGDGSESSATVHVPTLRGKSDTVAGNAPPSAPLARPLSEGGVSVGGVSVAAVGVTTTGALPADPRARLLALTASMYMPHGEQAWLHCAAELMVMLAKRAPSYDSNMFVNALDDDSKYALLDVEAGGGWGRSRDGGGGFGYGGASHFAPMFSQVLATESKVLIAATQQYAWSQTQTQRDGSDGGGGVGVAFTLAEAAASPRFGGVAATLDDELGLGLRVSGLERPGANGVAVSAKESGGAALPPRTGTSLPFRIGTSSPRHRRGVRFKRSVSHSTRFQHQVSCFYLPLHFVRILLTI